MGCLLYPPIFLVEGNDILGPKSTNETPRRKRTLLHALQPLWKHHSQTANIGTIFLQRLNSTPFCCSPSFQGFFLGATVMCLITSTLGSIPIAYEGWPRLDVLTRELAFYMETSLGHWERNLVKGLERDWLLHHVQIVDLVNLVQIY